jgi:hypothetical protein
MCISAADTGQYWLTLGCGGRAEIINELARNHDLLLSAAIHPLRSPIRN